jgi:hypothetical protein
MGALSHLMAAAKRTDTAGAASAAASATTETVRVVEASVEAAVVAVTAAEAELLPLYGALPHSVSASSADTSQRQAPASAVPSPCARRSAPCSAGNPPGLMNPSIRASCERPVALVTAASFCVDYGQGTAAAAKHRGEAGRRSRSSGERTLDNLPWVHTRRHTIIAPLRPRPRPRRRRRLHPDQRLVKLRDPSVGVKARSE